MITCPQCSHTFPSAMQISGGRARAKSLTPERRSEIARNAARARWDRVRTLRRIRRNEEEFRKGCMDKINEIIEGLEDDTE